MPLRSATRWEARLFSRIMEYTWLHPLSLIHIWKQKNHFLCRSWTLRFPFSALGFLPLILIVFSPFPSFIKTAENNHKFQIELDIVLKSYQNTRGALRDNVKKSAIFLGKIPKNKKVKYKYIIKNGNPSDKNAHYYFTIPKENDKL